MKDESEWTLAIRKYTGLPGVIYFSTKQEVKNSRLHPLGQVQWLDAGQAAFVSIKKGKDGKRKAGGDAQMVRRLEAFVSRNEDLLWDYWCTSPEQADSAETMRRFKRMLQEEAHDDG